ncbi:hypothetical protein [Haloarchaeobius iranensis]|uniref:SipW-cognate class signal peptide n=1 Tax=Haloarchaeobius iranensis TaxID=996166 RepID=A0A1G9TTY7_9EURY|nr:hypothetical protein [Haloarchaeobius iranensis]SDM50705.1 hypothetical protein SAMN05192554_103109 [Haloarchaeobius iranensis]
MSGLTRREILVGASVIGGAGALSTASTYGALVDLERFTGNSLQAGLLDLLVEWDHDGETGASDGQVSIDLGTLSPGEQGFVEFTVDLPESSEGINNPAYTWLRTFCPSTTGRLAGALGISLRYVDETGAYASDTLFEGTLCDVARTYQTGLPLDPAQDPNATVPGCLNAAEDGPLHLRLDYELAADYVGEETVGLGFEFAAVACRHADPTGAGPFSRAARVDCYCGPDRHGVSYVEVYVCEAGAPGCDCVLLGKLELDDKLPADCGIGTPATLGENYVEPGRYTLPVDDDCEGSGYDIVVTETASRPAEDDGRDEVVALAFRVEGDGDTPAPTLCQVAIKGGRGVAYYGPEDLDGNGTDGVLGAPENDDGTSTGGSTDDGTPGSGGGRR